MEIKSTNPLISSNRDVQRVEMPQSERAQRISGDQPEFDRVELSDRSREIDHLKELVQSTPDIRESRVEQVRQEVDSGTYNVRAEKIAEKIVSGGLLDEVF